MNTEERLERWRKAKADKDFATADAIRAELRAEGLDLDQPRKNSDAMEEKLEKWRAAKASRDFTTADQIRSELRAAGVDPDEPRTAKSKQWAIEEKVNQWRNAKQSKDWATADALRVELRGLGVDPDPPGGGGPMYDFSSAPPTQAPAPVPLRLTPIAAPAPAAAAYDPEQEAMLDQWQEAKAAKNWDTADAIRQSLRSRGVEASSYRPNILSVEEETFQWQQAKQARDFTRSDRLRASLRAKDADPEKQAGGFMGSTGGAAAQGGWGNQGGWSNQGSYGNQGSNAAQGGWGNQGSYGNQAGYGGQGGYGKDVEEELIQWFDARERKDWTVADEIRARLRQQGIEPSKCQRPNGYGKQTFAATGNSASPYGFV